MLTDEQVIPLCDRWAKRFLRQALAFNPTREGAYNELFNIAYIIAKPLDKLEGASTWIMYRLIKYVKSRKKDSRAKDYAYHIMRYRSQIDPSMGAEINEENKMLTNAIKKLDLMEQHLIAMRFENDLTFTQMAKVIGCSRRWAAIKLKRVLDKLREEMKCEK